MGQPRSFVGKIENGTRAVSVVEFVTICRAIGADPRRILTRLLKKWPDTSAKDHRRQNRLGKNWREDARSLIHCFVAQRIAGSGRRAMARTIGRGHAAGTCLPPTITLPTIRLSQLSFGLPAFFFARAKPTLGAGR